jgi:hypothetical protein
MGAQGLPHSIPLRKRRVLGWAFILSFCSWFALTFIWSHSARGGLADRMIRSLFFLPYVLGKHIAHVVFPDHGLDHAIRNSTGYYLGPVMGVAGEVIFLMMMWFVGIQIVRWIRAK